MTDAQPHDPLTAAMPTHLRRDHHRRRAQRAGHRRLPREGRATRCWCSSAARSSAAAASPRSSGPASRSPPPPTSTACLRPGDHPRPGAEEVRLRDAAAQPVVVHAVPRRPLPDDGAGQGDDPPRDRQVLARRTPRRYPKYEAMLERVADFLEPTLTQTPPEPVRPRPRRPVAARQARLALPQARHATWRPRRSRS